ncbi:MAG: 4-hydroxy-tetrahydrodipicolinate reductase [Eubacteriales bacterium]|nr:4-hydroxy-tetrahydrodipicolinate reductase [Eubacteriales bacterium]
MTRIIMNGCNGRMGQAITALIAGRDDIKIVCGTDTYDGIKNEYPVYPSLAMVTEDADVIVDFSNPSSLEGMLAYAKSKNLAVVVATTGLSEAQKQMLNSASKDIAVFFSANMSLGVNLLIELASKAAKVLEETFDIEIIEKHHNQKLDAPSGTALAIADGINDSLTEPQQYVYDRHSVRKKRSKTEIGIHSLRGGTIVGEHSVVFAGQDEVIEITHIAQSRQVFAAGAISAAKFVSGKPAGYYNMQSLVNAIQ